MVEKSAIQLKELAPLDFRWEDAQYIGYLVLVGMLLFSILNLGTSMKAFKRGFRSAMV